MTRPCVLANPKLLRHDSNPLRENASFQTTSSCYTPSICRLFGKFDWYCIARFTRAYHAFRAGHYLDPQSANATRALNSSRLIEALLPLKNLSSSFRTFLWTQLFWSFYLRGTRISCEAGKMNGERDRLTFSASYPLLKLWPLLSSITMIIHYNEKDNTTWPV